MGGVPARPGRGPAKRTAPPSPGLFAIPGALHRLPHRSEGRSSTPVPALPTPAAEGFGAPPPRPAAIAPSQGHALNPSPPLQRLSTPPAGAQWPRPRRPRRRRSPRAARCSGWATTPIRTRTTTSTAPSPPARTRCSPPGLGGPGPRGRRAAGGRPARQRPPPPSPGAPTDRAAPRRAGRPGGAAARPRAAAAPRRARNPRRPAPNHLPRRPRRARPPRPPRPPPEGLPRPPPGPAPTQHPGRPHRRDVRHRPGRAAVRPAAAVPAGVPGARGGRRARPVAQSARRVCRHSGAHMRGRSSRITCSRACPLHPLTSRSRPTRPSPAWRAPSAAASSSRSRW
jgi:hypothetical protein